jgi:DNA polymerase-1
MGALDDVKLHLVDSIDEMGELQRWMGQPRSILAVDTETQGLEWWHHRPRMVQVGDAREGWAVPWDLWGGAVLDALSKYEGPMVMHNAPFDVKIMETWCGYRFPRHRIHDTRVLTHIREPHLPTGLKNVCSRLIDSKAMRSQRMLHDAMKDNHWDWATVPLDFEPYWVYAALDPVLTAQLFEKIYNDVMAMSPAAYELEMGTSWAIISMERKGVALDTEWTQEKLTAFRQYEDQAADWIKDNFGLTPGKAQSIIERIAADTGYVFTAKTNGDMLSLDREVLEDVIAVTGHPLAEMVLSRRRIQKMASSYLKKFLELEHEGRVHASYNLLKNELSKYGARTGRMSISEPPLQQLPRKNNALPAAIAVRNCFTASEGNMLLMTDFNQIEARLLAHFSQDPGLIGAFGGGDFFVNIGRLLYSDPTMEKDDPRRPPTKNATYAKIYCAGVEKFAKTARIPIDQAEAIYNRLGAMFPGMDRFIQEVIGVGQRRLKDEGHPYVISPLTGRRYIGESDKVYALVNYLIQGTAAEVLKYKDLELFRAGLGDYMILNVHDEVILDVPKEDVEDVRHKVESIMNDDRLFTVPLTVDSDVAFRWGEK